MRSIIGFLRKTHGLTTIEWVSLCAVVLLAAFGISAYVLQGADELGGAIGDTMSDAADDMN